LTSLELFHVFKNQLINQLLTRNKIIMSNEKDWFDKAESIAKVGSLILLPIIILFLTNSYTSNENEKARRAEYIKISINILQEKPEKEKEDVRAWAVNVYFWFKLLLFFYIR
jgi:hypothetical protein